MNLLIGIHERNSLVSASDRKDVADIYQAIQHMNRIVTDVADHQLLQTGKMQLVLTPVQLAPLISVW